MTTAVFVETAGLLERGLTILIAIMIVTIVKKSFHRFPNMNGDVTAFTGYWQQNIDDRTVEGGQLT
jgi:hypothetical protein